MKIVYVLTPRIPGSPIRVSLKPLNMCSQKIQREYTEVPAPLLPKQNIIAYSM
jgi:hypothetical protein